MHKPPNQKKTKILNESMTANIKKSKHIITNKNYCDTNITTTTSSTKKRVNSPPKVSIIIPIYNVVDYLDECIQSIQNQTFQDIEIICIDDCSVDGSYEKICQYQKKDSRIKIYRNSTNKKQGFSRNFGIQ